MHKKVPLKLLQPNPYRDMDRYPIQEDKIRAILDSYESTGYWGNLVARKQNGCYQLAYGHHRREGLLRTLKPNALVEVILKPLTNDQMLRMMSDENMAEWASDATRDVEIVKALVLAYAEGSIELPPSGKCPAYKLRYAPSAIPGVPSARIKETKPYTEKAMCEKMGWTDHNRMAAALGLLELLERKVLTERLLRGVSSTAAKQMAILAKATLREYANKANVQEELGHRQKAVALRRKGQNAATSMAKAFCEVASSGGKRSTAAAVQAARKAKPKAQGKPPKLDKWVDSLAHKINAVLRDDRIAHDYNAMIPHIHLVNPTAKNTLIKSLRSLQERARECLKRVQNDERTKLLKEGMTR